MRFDDAEAGDRGDHGERPIAEPSRGRQNAGPKPACLRRKGPPPKQHPPCYRQNVPRSLWEQCREWGEREDEDEPAQKKGEQPPVSPDQLVAVGNLREKFSNFIGKGRAAVGFVESSCVYLVLAGATQNQMLLATVESIWHHMDSSPLWQQFNVHIGSRAWRLEMARRSSDYPRGTASARDGRMAGYVPASRKCEKESA